MATTLYLTAFSPTTHLGTNNLRRDGVASAWAVRDLATSRGNANTSSGATATVTGPTNGLEITVGGVPLEFISAPLAADVTIAGTITANLWSLESDVLANVAPNVIIDIIRANSFGSDGSNEIVNVVQSTNTTEMTTVGAVQNFTTGMTSGAYTSQTANRGDRLRVRFIGDDAGTMATGFTFTLRYNGQLGGGSGDTFVIFTEDMTFAPYPAGTKLYLTTESAYAGRSPNFLSDFTGANETPLSEGGNWAQLDTLTNPMKRSSDQALGSVSATNESYWTAEDFGPDLEAYGTLVLFGTAPAIVVRIQGEGGANTWDGYRIFANSAGATFIYVVTNGSATLIANDTTVWATGDKLGVRCVGSLIQAWRLPSGSSTWRPVLTVTDSTYPAAGKVGLHSPSQISGFDDFYASTYASTGSSLFTNKLSSARGASSSEIRTAYLSNGWLNPQPIAEWYTAQLTAFTLTGTARVNLRARESSSTGNLSLRCEIARVDWDGANATVWGSWCISADTVRLGELATSDSAEIAWVSGDDLAISDGQRLRLRVYYDDYSAAAVAAAPSSMFLTHNGPSPNINGDAYVIFPQEIEPLPSYRQRLYGPAELSTTPTELYAASSRTTIRHVYINNPAAETVKPTLSIGADAASTRFMDLQDIEAGEAWDTRRRTEHTLEAGETVQGWYEGYSSVVLADSPIAYYRMNEASGLPQDSSGNGNHMTSSLGTPVYSQAGPLSGDSTDGGIRFKEADTDHFAGPDIDVGDVFTIEAWIKRNDFATDEYVAVSMGSQEAGLYVHANFAKLAKTSVDFVASSLLTIDNDGFYDHVVVTKDGSTRKVYINGADDTNISGFTDQTMTANTEPTSLGVEYAGGSPNGRFEGTLSEVAIYPTALSAARVLAHYQAALASGPPVIVLDGYVEPS